MVAACVALVPTGYAWLSFGTYEVVPEALKHSACHTISRLTYGVNDNQRSLYANISQSFMLQKEPYRVALIAFEGVHSLDISGPWEVFNTANRMMGKKPGYALQLVGSPSRQITSSSGLRWVCDARLADYQHRIHTLLVCGGDGIHNACQSKTFVHSIQRLATFSDRVGSICTGVFALAAAGLLDGRKATTHWSACERLASDYPSIQVDCDSIYQDLRIDS